jgi:hypothetical protein
MRNHFQVRPTVYERRPSRSKQSNKCCMDRMGWGWIVFVLTSHRPETLSVYDRKGFFFLGCGLGVHKKKEIEPFVSICRFVLSMLWEKGMHCSNLNMNELKKNHRYGGGGAGKRDCRCNADRKRNLSTILIPQKGSLFFFTRKKERRRMLSLWTTSTSCGRRTIDRFL